MRWFRPGAVASCTMRKLPGFGRVPMGATKQRFLKRSLNSRRVRGPITLSIVGSDSARKRSRISPKNGAAVW